MTVLTSPVAIGLNFWNEAWCAISCMWFFEQLSSSLLLLVETQCFGRCILWLSSDVPCLSGHKNDSTWEIFFKLWKWVPSFNHFYVQINEGHLRKARGYSSWNVVFQLITIKLRTTVRKITYKIFSSCVQHILLIFNKWFARCEVSGHTTAFW